MKDQSSSFFFLEEETRSGMGTLSISKSELKLNDISVFLRVSGEIKRTLMGIKVELVVLTVFLTMMKFIISKI
ncbi:hypothetical protein MKW98_018206 [Papaver atlanticum]|uniref:Uncharacterized protein n=1 Tax=Papaver atlanticum TaxID=357466 RepID=A0AAD4RVC2_9MAGN|nr:hypothetical protein MKW98_018206 [Papaver atlanticum]